MIHLETEVILAALAAVVIVVVLLVVRFVRKNKDIILETLDEVDQEMIQRRIDIGTAIDRISGIATLTRKYVREEYKGGTIYHVPTFLFTFEDQSEIVLSVGMDIYNQLEEGVSDNLTVRYGEFESFGAELNELDEEIAPFFMESFDEMFDHPVSDVYEPGELFEPGEGALVSEEEARLKELYEAGKPLPVTRLRAKDITEQLFDYSPLSLIRISGMPAFLRRESAIQDLYHDCFKLACQAFVTNYEKEGLGAKTDRITRNGNTFTLYLVVQDDPNSDAYAFDSAFFINTDV